MARLWICGIMQNNYKEVKEILDPLEHLLETGELGTFWVDGGSDTHDALGYILGVDGLSRRRLWTDDHDFQMNEYLRDPRIKHGDWIIQCDTSERIHPDFVHKLLDTMLANFEEQGINTVYQRSKPMLFRKFDDQFFAGSPHWGLQGQRQQMVDISKFDGFEDDKSYFWSNRDDINKWIINGIKYYLVYGRSNHMWLIYSPQNYPGSAPSLIHEHEEKRLRFRDYCRNVIRLPYDSGASAVLSAFDDYLKQSKFDEEFIQFMNYEKVIANYYRYVVGEEQRHIYDTQNKWQYERRFWTCPTCENTYQRRPWRAEWGVAACLSFVECDKFNDCCSIECMK